MVSYLQLENRLACLSFRDVYSRLSKTCVLLRDFLSHIKCTPNLSVATEPPDLILLFMSSLLMDIVFIAVSSISNRNGLVVCDAALPTDAKDASGLRLLEPFSSVSSLSSFKIIERVTCPEWHQRIILLENSPAARGCAEAQNDVSRISWKHASIDTEN